MTSFSNTPSARSLDGSWAFRFEENRPLEDAADPAFIPTGVQCVPGCFDLCPAQYLRHGTGLYRRTFVLDAPMRDAVLVVDGMGIRSTFALDGRDLGVHVFPYARLEIPVGPLAAGEHTIFAAADNLMDWPRVKLARPYYDFYFYGGFYHGIRLVERQPRVFVRTLDYRTGTVEVEVENGPVSTLRIPDFKLWSPEAPHLTTLRVGDQTVRFGIRQFEARDGKFFLNGKEIFLKGFNRHESDWLNGAATPDSLMLQDLQRLKALGGNFIRGAHYQQSERFLDLCDELGVLVWEESLGWGNGQKYVNDTFPPNELADPEFRALQVEQTRNMVRASFNHPSVVIQGFLNECESTTPEAKTLVDELIAAIRAERPGRLVSFACNLPWGDICNENTDFIAFNAYPGTIPMAPGTPEQLAQKVRDDFNGIVAHLRRRYPGKTIMVSESGCGGVFGAHSENASPNTEEFQEEYLRDILETLWANPDVAGFSIWQMNDGRTRERYCDKTVSAMFGGSVAGVFDALRRPKKSAETVNSFFARK